MTTQEQYIERLKELVIVKYGRQIASAEECEALVEAVAEKTRVSLSANTLEQIFVVSDSKFMPRPHVLSTLARYAGYAGWSDFCTSSDVLPTNDRDNLATPRHWGVIILTVAALAIVIITAIVLLRGSNDNKTSSNRATTHVESIDSRFTQVKSEWIASTTEHCLAVREYEGMDIEAYRAHVEKVNSEYVSLMEEGIRRDLVLYAAAHNITVDDATIERTARAIAEICSTMCECLTNEASAGI